MSGANVSSGFYLMVTGQVDACQMQGFDNLYVKYSFNKGHDWSVLAGVEHGVSQIAKRSSGGGSSTDTLTWNYPLDIMFRSSNVHGWPQIVLGVYGLTAFGGDVVRGYGCTHVPTQVGRYTRYVQLYTPISSSLCQRLSAWITNNPPEFFDSKFIAQGKGREVTRVRSHGVVKITFNVTTKNMQQWGYQMQNERASSAPAGAGGAASIGAGMGYDGQPNYAQLDAISRPGSANPSAFGNLSARSGGGGGGMDSARGPGFDRASSSAAALGVPPRTQLSASTTAGLNRQRSLASTGGAGAASSASINPPSRENSRRDLFAQQQPSASSGFESSTDEFEAKYPTSGADRQASSLSQRGGSGMRPADNMMAGPGGQSMGQLAPLRQGSRQPPM